MVCYLRQVCLSRDIHEWGADRLNDMQAKWEPTPDHMILMDVKVRACAGGGGCCAVTAVTAVYVFVAVPSVRFGFGFGVLEKLIC